MDSSINRDWIKGEFTKGIDAELSMASNAKERAGSPPDEELGVLYHEIAAADERHARIVETVAIRYGYTPTRAGPGGIGETLKTLTEKVAGTVLGKNPLEQVGHDLAAKAEAMHWYTAWIAAFEAIGDVESARELSAVLTEEKAHRDALQEGLNRMVTRGARGEIAAAAAK